MTWRSITDDELALCLKMARWLEIRQRWCPEEDFVPCEADITKSALFERLRAGRQPLEYPPPVALACPWYALVEDPGPHYVGDGKGIGPYFGPSGFLKKNEVNILQNRYEIVGREDKRFTVKYSYYDSPYRFHLWFDENFQLGDKEAGAWLMANVEFANERVGVDE